MHIAIIGCGEVGGAYGRALGGKAELSLCDIVADGRPGALAAELGLPLHTAPGDWLLHCDTVIAAVPGRASPAAAAAALGFLSQDAHYIDVSTAAPGDLRASAEKFEAAGRAFTDTAIMGAIALTGGATPVLLAGAGGERAQEVFAMLGAAAQRLDGARPGDAVALKLLRSVVVKGLECLAIESLTAAEHLGVRDRLFDVLGDLDESPAADLLSALVTTHLLHAERRMHEMEESVAQLRTLGFDAAVASGLEHRYRATLRALETDPPAEDAHESLDAALAWLTRIGRGARA